MIGQCERYFILGNISARRHLDQTVGSSRQIAELHVAVLIYCERILPVLCPDAVAVVVRDDNASTCWRLFTFRKDCPDRLIVLIDQAELDKRERLIRKEIHLIDLQTDRLVRNLGCSRHMTVVIDLERKGFLVDREPLGGNGFVVGVFICRKLRQNDFAIRIGFAFKDHIAVAVFDLDHSIRNRLTGGQIALTESDFVGFVRALVYQRDLIIGCQMNLEYFIRKDKTGRRHDLANVVGPDRQINRQSITILVSRHGAI